MSPRLRRGILASAAVIALMFVSVVASAGSVTYTYDSLDRLIKAEYQDGRVIQYTYDSAGNRTATYDNAVPPITAANPQGGLYYSAQSVTLTCTDMSGYGCDKTYYTTDGTTPTTSSSPYSSPINISVTTTLKFFSTDLASNSESVKTQTYTIIDNTPPTTTASPAGGTYNSAQSVTLACTDGSGSGCDKTYYTTDGTTPTISSSPYSSPINITVTTTLKFFSTDLASNSESVKTEIYTIDTTPPTGTITINSGAASTNSLNVTLTLTCSDTSGCSQMKFSNDVDNDASYSTPETYSATKAWTLSSGTGTKTVYAKFKDAGGNWSTAYSDSIEYTGVWLSGWNYRKSVTLSRALGAVSNYQMKLLVGETSGATGEDVDCGGHIRSDFADLRFTNFNGDLLDYWIESIIGTTPNRLATVRIEFDSIGTSATTFYMYYGNSGASAYSNGDNTFVLFDDFLGSTLNTSKWNQVGTVTVSSGAVITNGNTNGNRWHSKSAYYGNYALYFRLKSTGAYARCGFQKDVTTFLNNGDPSDHIGIQDSAGTVYTNFRNSANYQSADSGTDGNFHILEMLWLPGTSAQIKYDGTNLRTVTDAAYVPNEAMFVKGADYLTADYVFLRNYVSPEPAWGSWGNEEGL